MSRRVILLRHGQTYSNLNRRLDTRPPGAELTELGREQARAAGVELAEYSNSRLHRVVSSVAIRAQQTAVGAMHSFEESLGRPKGSMLIDVHQGLHEVFAGEYEMADTVAAHESYLQALAGWLRGDPRAAMPGGETYADLLGRYRPQLESLVEQHLGTKQDSAQEDPAQEDPAERDLLIVSHGAAIRTVATHATGVDPEFAYQAYLPNCRFIVLETQDRPFGQWKLRRWVDEEF